MNKKKSGVHPPKTDTYSSSIDIIYPFLISAICFLAFIVLFTREDSSWSNFFAYLISLGIGMTTFSNGYANYLGSLKVSSQIPAYHPSNGTSQYYPYRNSITNELESDYKSTIYRRPSHATEFTSPIPKLDLDIPDTSPLLSTRLPVSPIASSSMDYSYASPISSTFLRNPSPEPEIHRGDWGMRPRGPTIGFGEMNFPGYGMDRGEERRNFPQTGYYPYDTRKTEPTSTYRTLSVSNDKKVAKETDQYFKSLEVSKLYYELNVADKIDNWSETMRRWLSTMILKMLVKHISELEQKIGRSLKTAPAYMSNNLSFTWNTHANIPDQQLASALAQLENYLQIGEGTREYLIDRIHELAEGEWISKFSPENNQGNVSDTKILLHLFCTFMDEQLREPNTQSKPFTTRYLAITPANPETYNAAILLYQTSIHPPHINLFVSGKMWEIQPGRNNLFHAFVLFVWYIKNHRKGYLQQINLNSFHLASVVDD